MRGRARRRDVNVFGLSFLDVLANTVGGLAFLLILSVLTIQNIAYSPPKILTRTLPDGYRGAEYQTWLSAQEGQGRYRWSFDGGKPPPGLQVDANTGLLFGVPRLSGEEPQERFEFEVKCEGPDESGGGIGTWDRRRFALTVHSKAPADVPALRIRTPAVVPVALRGQPYPLVLAAEGGQPPYRWAASSGLPAGLQLDPDGTLRGAPAGTGEFQVDISVTTARGERASSRLSLAVQEPHTPPPLTPPELAKPLSISTRALPPLILGEDADLVLAAEGGTPPYRWSAQGLAEGLRLVDSKLVGRPGQAGEYAPEIVLRDASEQSATARPRLSIRHVVPYWQFVMVLLLLLAAGTAIAWLMRRLGKRLPLRVCTEELPNGRASFPYTVQLACVGGAPPYKWRVAEGSLPPGMSLTEGGRLSGQPYKDVPVTKTLEHRFTVEVCDAQGMRARHEL